MGTWTAFAELLSYPRADVLALADACVAALDGTEGIAAPELRTFRTEAERLGLSRLEEVYAAAFDFDPTCSLSVGHHVFGETARRSFFMCRLAEVYRDGGVCARGDELPDHLPAILRYLDASAGSLEVEELVTDAVMPALQRVAESLGRANHPYAPVVRALLACLAASLGGRQGAFV